MSLRNLLGLGRKLLKKKTETATPETIRTSTVAGLPEINPSSLRTQAQVPVPQTIAEQSKALVVKDPVISKPFALRPMDSLKNTLIGKGDDVIDQDKLFGSVTFDRIVQKGDGSFSADDWANWLTDRGKRSFKLFGRDFEDGYVTGRRFKLDEGFAKGSYLRNKEQTVPMEELFDSNIATFDRAGDLSGGLLYAAKQAGIKVPGRLLADMVKDNPANRLRITEFGIPGNLINKAENIVQQNVAKVDSIEKTLTTSYLKEANKIGDTVIDQENLAQLAKEYKFALRELKGELTTLADSVASGKVVAAQNTGKRIATVMKQLKSGANPQQKLAFNKIQGEVDDLVASTKGMRSPHYATQEGYTFPGGQNYREAVLSLDEVIPGNSSLGRRRNPHFDGELKEITNPLAHIRWDTRTTSDGKKAFLISEIQSDTNQGISKFLREQGQEPLNTMMRTNPYQQEKVIEFLSQSRKKLSDDIIKGGLRGSEIELKSNQIKKLDNYISGVTKKTDASYGTYGKVSSGFGFTPEKVDYFPLLDRASQAKATISYLTNLAAKEGVDYISVVPANYMKRGMEPAKVKAYTDFYGYPKGNKTPGSKSLAVIPDILKKMGKEFDTKAGVIKISKSDVTKPFKRIQTEEVGVPGDRTYKIDTHRSARIGKEGDENFEYIPDNDLRLYTDVFSVKVSPNMLNPQKLYKKEGGFISKYN